MRLTLSRRAIAPCAALATTAILGSALVAAPASTATAAEAFARTISVEGTATSDSTGSLWEARAGFTGGTYWKPAAFEVAGTVDDKLYQAELWGLTAWQTAVPSNGEYDVTLRMREVFYSAPGQRVFDVTAEGKPALTGVDIVKSVGARTAYDRTFRVTVSDGRLDLGFRASVDKALVSAIKVTAVAPSETGGSTTPTKAPTPATVTPILAVTHVANAATVSWTTSARPSKGWVIGRDGVDATGYGAWSTTLTAEKRTQTFTALVSGRTYTFSLTNLDTGERVTKSATISSNSTFTPTPAPTTPVSPSPAPTTPAPTTPAPTTPAPTTPGPVSTPTPAPPTLPGTTVTPGKNLLGTSRSGKTWFSGAWRGAPFTPASSEAIGTWRGSPMDAATTYSNKESLNAIANSQWNINTFNGFGGILAYNLTLVPYDRSASFASVARGDQDWVWRQNAQLLKANGRGTSLVNIGWEMNGNWWPWSGTASSAEQYKAAFNRVATVMRAEAPGLKFGFIIACGTGMTGSSNRLDAMTKFYPGDANVDVVGCNTYDWWGDKARNDAEFAHHVRPARAPGITDFAEFARAHRKGMAIPEWGPAATSVQGSGDNPFYIRKMHEWMTANRDVLVLENYFMEAGSNVANSLVGPTQMPKAAAEYQRLW